MIVLVLVKQRSDFNLTLVKQRSDLMTDRLLTPLCFAAKFRLQAEILDPCLQANNNIVIKCSLSNVSNQFLLIFTLFHIHLPFRIVKGRRRNARDSARIQYIDFPLNASEFYINIVNSMLIYLYLCLF